MHLPLTKTDEVKQTKHLLFDSLFKYANCY